jgi:hypothetical protein
MGFADVDGQEISVIFVVVVDGSDVANLAAEGRSGEAAEDEHQRFLAGAFADVKMFVAVECH